MFDSLLCNLHSFTVLLFVFYFLLCIWNNLSFFASLFIMLQAFILVALHFKFFFLFFLMLLPFLVDLYFIRCSRIIFHIYTNLCTTNDLAQHIKYSLHLTGSIARAGCTSSFHVRLPVFLFRFAAPAFASIVEFEYIALPSSFIWVDPIDELIAELEKERVGRVSNRRPSTSTI